MSAFVMVIDDSLTIRKILETCLEREGYHIESFCDGVEAMKWLTLPQACIPQLVFVDVGLPKMGGYEVIQRLKARHSLRQTTFVILSRRDGILDRLKGRFAGA